MPDEKPVAWRPVGNCPPHVPPRNTLAATRGRRPVSKQGRMGWTQPAAGVPQDRHAHKRRSQTTEPTGSSQRPNKATGPATMQKARLEKPAPTDPWRGPIANRFGPWLSNRRGKCDQRRPEWQGERPSFKLTRDSEVRWSRIFIVLQTSKCRGPTSGGDLSAP